MRASSPLPAAGKADPRVVVPESRFALIDASVVGGRLLTQYLEDARSVVRAVDLNGKQLYDVKLPVSARRSASPATSPMRRPFSRTRIF